LTDATAEDWQFFRQSKLEKTAQGDRGLAAMRNRRDETDLNKVERHIVERPDSADIGAVMERIVASPGFSKSGQLSNFLRFIVAETLAGRPEHIKAYTIAVDALGRDASFDPQADPIVRVEAGRLRRALEHYYENGGRNDPIVIELPRGSYVPLFRTNSPPRRAFVRLDELRLRATRFARDNYRQTLLIAAIATIVSLTVELLEHTIWPGD
jgi:hypothetical protein